MTKTSRTSASGAGAVPRADGVGWLAALAAAALLALAATLTPLTAQGRYPASNAGAPEGVYSAPRLAIDSLEALLVRDSLDYGANWRIAGALTTLGALAGDAGRIATRDSLYARALRFSRRAVRIAPDRPEGHFMLAQVLERRGRGAPLRDHVDLSREVLSSSRKAIEVDPAHDGAWSSLGRWHMATWRMSPVKRFVAMRFLGGAEMSEASSEEGIRALEHAVSLRPNWIPHRLELARAYLDVERNEDAQLELDMIADLRPNGPEDGWHQREAARISEWLAGGGPSAFDAVLARVATLW